MRETFQLLGEVWSAVLVLLVLAVLLHYGYQQVQGWWKKREQNRTNEGVIRRFIARAECVGVERPYGIDPKDWPPPITLKKITLHAEDFPCPMICQPSNPEWGRVDPTLPAPTSKDLRGFILESRRFEPGTDQEIIARLMGQETADE